MHEIRALLRRAAWRLAFTEFVRSLVVALAAGIAGLIVLRLVQQLWPLEAQLDWVRIGAWTAGAAAVAALAWTLFTRANPKTVARRVDEGAQLRETISTAMCVAGSDEPWARVVVDSAVDKARAVKLREAVPIQPPRFWPVPLALALTMLVVWLAVQQRTTAESVAKAEEKAEVVKAAEQKKEVDAKIDEWTSQLKLDEGNKDQDAKAEADKLTPKTPEAIRLEVIKKLSNVSDRLEQLREGDKGARTDSVQDSMKQLKTPGPGPLQELSKELAKGNFDKAAEELAKALEKMKNGEMSEQDMKKMAEQLKQLADQLNKIGEDNKQLEKDLEKAGLSKELAKDPEALKKALENNQNLSEEQKQQLMQQAQAKKESSELCKNLSKCMNGMCQSMSKEGMSQEGMNQAQELAQQLSEMEMMKSEMESLEAAMNECKSQMDKLASQCKGGKCEGMGECEGGDPNKNGEWKSGWSNKKGKGSGGPGIGNGTGRPDAKADFTTKTERDMGKMGNGPTIGSTLVDGEQVRGESKAQLADALQKASESADEAIAENRVPREYQEAVKNLYGKLKKKLDDKKAAEEPKKDDAK
jgi:hypothetical protein